MKYIVKKTCTLIITLFIVSLLAFLAFQIIPGDPTTDLLGTEATEEARQALRQELGLDRPVLVRYFDWLSGFVRGDMGESYNYRMPVRDMLADKLPVTALLTLLSFVFTIALSIPLGIWAGSTRSRIMDLSISALDQIVMSVPPFFLGMLGCFFGGGVLSTLACHLFSAPAIWLNLLPLGIVLARLIHADLNEEKDLLSQKPAGH